MRRRLTIDAGNEWKTTLYTESEILISLDVLGRVVLKLNEGAQWIFPGYTVIDVETL